MDLADSTINVGCWSMERVKCRLAMQKGVNNIGVRGLGIAKIANVLKNQNIIYGSRRDLFALVEGN